MPQDNAAEKQHTSVVLRERDVERIQKLIDVCAKNDKQFKSVVDAAMYVFKKGLDTFGTAQVTSLQTKYARKLATHTQELTSLMLSNRITAAEFAKQVQEYQKLYSIDKWETELT